MIANKLGERGLMDNFYTGEFRVVMDDKGRMRIPNKIKTQLGNAQYMICAGTDKSLLLMTNEEFKEKVVELANDTKLSEFDKQNALRALSSTVFFPEEDAQGRFVLQEKLKEYAGIKKEIVFLGAFTRIEIWAAERYKYCAVNELDINSIVKELGL